MAVLAVSHLRCISKEEQPTTPLLSKQFLAKHAQTQEQVQLVSIRKPLLKLDGNKMNAAEYMH